MEDFGIQLSTLDISKIPKIEMPPPADDGRIPVFNGKGYATLELEPISEEFINYSSTIKSPVLDAGAGYGLTTISALKKGATVICNEIEQKQLDYIAQMKDITEEEKKRLYLKKGSILEIDFPKESIGAIHLSRVMHFFTPEEVEKIFEKIYKWLTPNGRCYIVTMSQYHYGNPEKFYEFYNKEKKNGTKWPGMINDYKFKGEKYVLHAIDPILMMEIATKYDFTCKKIELWGGPNDDDYTCAILIKNYHHN